MRRFVFLCLLFLLSGCGSDKQIVFNIDDITDIKYYDITLVKEDYNLISDISNMSMKILDETNIDGNNLTIKTKDNLYDFKVTNNYIIYTEGNKKYYIENDDLIIKLTSLYNKYTNNEFYSIERVDTYDTSENPLLVKLDQGNGYVKLVSSENMYNFKIHQIERGNNVYNDVDLLYSSGMIDMNRNVILRVTDVSNIRISFDTPYNHYVSILYDGEKFVGDFGAK